MLHKGVFLVGLALAFLLLIRAEAAAQSNDHNLPTPVLTNEITGTIPALDIGDPRLTQHFYVFDGIHGDLFVTVESKNLNGDLDIFTAVTFKPLMKISMFASASATEATKSIYLRGHKILILRIEARSPNDEEATYHIRFHGAFAPFSGGIPVAETAEPGSEVAKSEVRKSTSKKTKRVSSVGARVEEPVTQAAEASAEREEKRAATEKPAEKSTAVSETRAVSTESSPARSASAKTEETARTEPAKTRTRRGSRRGRARGNAKPRHAKTETEAKNGPANPRAGAAPEGDEKSGTTGAAKLASAAQQERTAAPPSGPRLIIEEKDGTRVDRPMATVRRVIIGNGLIVIVLKNGRIERVPMSMVARMAIEP